MPILSCVIVEDEPLAREVLEGFIAEVPSLTLLASAKDIHTGRELILDLDPDLLFLDIHMPEGDGIALLTSLVDPPMVIFTTAYAEYAVTGFELNAVDYLLKPFSFDRFKTAVEKAHTQWETRPALQPKAKNSFITLKIDKRWVKIDFEAIYYIQAFGDYVKVFSQEKTWVAKETLKSLVEKLPTRDFVQVHKSYVCRLEAIQFVEGNQVKVQDAVLPIGASFKQQLFERLQV